MFLNNSPLQSIYCDITEEEIRRMETAFTHKSLQEKIHRNISVKNIQFKGKLCRLPASIFQAGHKATAMVWTADTSLSQQRKTGREPKVTPVFSLNMAALGKLPVLMFLKVIMPCAQKSRGKMNVELYQLWTKKETMCCSKSGKQGH